MSGQKSGGQENGGFNEFDAQRIRDLLEPNADASDAPKVKKNAADDKAATKPDKSISDRLRGL